MTNDVRLIQLFAVNDDVSLLKGYDFARQSDYSFAQHDAMAGVHNRDYVTPFGRVKGIRKAVDEIDLILFVSRKHADSFDTDRQQDVRANRQKENNPDYDSRQRTGWFAPDNDPPKQARLSDSLNLS
jgi:hypothetical protein